LTSRIVSSVPRTSTTSSGADTPVRARLRTSLSSCVTWRSQWSKRPSGVKSAGRSDANSGSFAGSALIGCASSNPKISFAASGP
jgi:hypothetical protein